MAYTIPSDSHVVGNSGHTADHNNIADMLTLISDANVKNTAYSGGATGNGVTDDTAAINAAINAAAAGAGIVLFPPGNYITQPLQIPPGVILQGTTGQGYKDLVATVANSSTLSQLTLKAGSNAPLISPYDGGANYSTQVEIRELALNCNNIAQPAINFPDNSGGGGIGRFWYIDRCYIYNTGSGSGYAVYIGILQGGVTLRDTSIYAGTSGSAAGYNGVGWQGPDGFMTNCWIGFFSNIGLDVLGGASDLCLQVEAGGIFGNDWGVIVEGAGVTFTSVSIDGNQNAWRLRQLRPFSVHRLPVRKQLRLRVRKLPEHLHRQQQRRNDTDRVPRGKHRPELHDPAQHRLDRGCL